MNEHRNALPPAILKANWERYRQPVPLSLRALRDLVEPLCTDDIIDSALLSDGCANTNYKISFANHAPVVVRIYTRDPLALARERDLHQLVQGKLPAPPVLVADDSQKKLAYPFAIFSYVEGISLRDLIFTGETHAIARCYFDAGQQIAALSRITFPTGGFFESNLRIRPFARDDAYLNYALSLLKSSTVKRDLGLPLSKRVYDLINSTRDLLPDNSHGACLVHADFDPANIKVVNSDGIWRISGILDWEFAFAGSSFSDIGQMMRYSHKLAPLYETSFYNGIHAGGLALPSNGKHCARLMDLLSLLHIMHSNPSNRRPVVNSDVKSLIAESVQRWPR